MPGTIPKDKRGSKGLTFSQDKFARALVQTGTYHEAFLIARPETAKPLTRAERSMRGRVWANYPPVAKRIDQMRAQARKRNDDVVDRLIHELAGIAFSDIRDVLDFDKDGVTIKNSEDIPDSVARTISEVSSDGDKVKVKLYDKLAAIDKLGKHLGMFVERRELTGAGGKDLIPKQMDDLELARLVAFLMGNGERQQAALTVIDTDSETVNE
jgi:phage terminase small subunit